MDWIVYTNPTDGTVVYASPKSGAVSLPAAASVDQAVLAFLASNKATFQMVDPASELGAATVSTADNGTVTVHFAQAQNGVPVYAADWSAHLDPSGKLTSMGGAYVPGLAAISTTPALAASAAATAAVAAVVPMEPGVPTASFTATAPSLEIFAVDVAPTLAWSTRVEVAGGDAYEVHVDASTGALIVAIDAHQTATASAPGAQSYAPYNQTGSTVSFVIGDGMPAPLDGTDNGYEIRTTALAAATTPITSPMASPWNDGTMPPGAAVSAQANAQIVLAFYAKHNGKDGKPFLSYDGAGSVLTSIINDNGSGGNGRDNAFWDTKSAMHYGDGIPGSLVWPQSSSLDTVAHEITHGVTQHTSMLSSAVQEAYAINESFSDTFAAFITHRIRGNDATDFIFSEDDNNAHVAVRSMVHPADPTLREGRGEQYYPSIVSHEQPPAEQPLEQRLLPPHARWDERRVAPHGELRHRLGRRRVALLEARDGVHDVAGDVQEARRRLALGGQGARHRAAADRVRLVGRRRARGRRSQGLGRHLPAERRRRGRRGRERRRRQPAGEHGTAGRLQRRVHRLRRRHLGRPAHQQRRRQIANREIGKPRKRKRKRVAGRARAAGSSRV